MLIDGTAIANQIQQEIKETLSRLPGRRPCLALIIVGENPASLIYVSRKSAACALVGIESRICALPADVSEDKLIAEIESLNADEIVDGILIQLPLPAHLNPINIISKILPEKDVDGLHPYNVGKMLIGDPDTFLPCTPLGIKELMLRSGVEVQGKQVLVIGRSNIVGKPMAAILMQNASGANATVTIAHSRTVGIKELCLRADIVIVAMGHPGFITADMIKDGAVVIDVGINRVSAPNTTRGYKVVGDVDFDTVKDKCSFITPVPGGVGPMTIAMLLSNTCKSYMNRYELC